MTTTKAVDEKAITEAFVRFKEEVQGVMDEQDELIVELGFESSITPKEHYEFAQDEPVMYKDIVVDRGLKGIAVVVASGVEDKLIKLSDCDLVKGYSYPGGKKVSVNLIELITDAFAYTYADLLGSIDDLEEAIKTKPKILNALADPDKAMGAFAARDAYSAINNYGRY